MRRDVIVIGASAGGVEALSQLAAALPADFPAAVLVVVHFPAHATSMLPSILQRRGPLPALHPHDGTAIRPGVIYVAPPNLHLLVRRGTVRLVRGPRENGHRPAVDPLFRSAAVAYGSRVVGVVLSGNLDDGTAGLAAIHHRGGVCVVQDPDEAMYAGMPLSALSNVPVDHVVEIADLPALLLELVDAPAAPEEDDVEEPGEERSAGDRDAFETEIDAMNPKALVDDDRPGTPSAFTCPECHGVLFELRDGQLVRFRCRVGHAYGAETLLAEQGGAVEAALWTAMRALKERAALARRMSERMAARGSARSAGSFAEQADEADARADLIRRVLQYGGGFDDGVEPEQTATAAIA